MTPAALPSDEAERLRILHELRILDSEPEECFDAAVRLVTRLMNCPIAMVSLVDAERQWFKAVHGMEIRQTPRAEAFCADRTVRSLAHSDPSTSTKPGRTSGSRPLVAIVSTSVPGQP